MCMWCLLKWRLYLYTVTILINLVSENSENTLKIGKTVKFSYVIIKDSSNFQFVSYVIVSNYYGSK